MMEEKIYERIDEGIEKATDSVIPFQVSKDDEIAVVGDANATELNKHNFKIEFKIPMGDKYEKHEKEFKDVYLKPRHETRLVKFMTAILPYYRKVTEDGGVVRYTPAEQEGIRKAFSEDIYDMMYDIVATVLGIDPELKDYMTRKSVTEATANIIEMFPELVNESDTFFE